MMKTKLKPVAALLLWLLAFVACFSKPAEDRKLGATFGVPVVYHDPISELGLPTAAQKAAYAATANWYVSASGTTTGTGTAANDPILPSELSRRLNGVTLTVAGEMLITYDAAGDPTHPLYVTWNTPGGAQTRIKGTPTSVLTGTVTTWRDKTPASNITHGITDSALGSANAWTAQLQRRWRDTTAPRANAIAWIAKDEGSKTARISPPYLGSSAYPFNFFGYALTPAATNDAYVIETLSPIPTIVFQGSHSLPAFTDGRIVVEDMQLTASLNVHSQTHVSFVNSYLYYVQSYGSDVQFVGCNFVFGIGATGGAPQLYGSSFGGSGVSSFAGASVSVADSLFQGAGSQLSVSNNSFLSLAGDVGLFDNTSVPVVASYGGLLYTGGKNLFGNGHSLNAVRVSEGGRLAYNTTKPTVTGTSDVVIDGATTLAWTTGVPFTDKVSLSGVFVVNTSSGRNGPVYNFAAFSSLTTNVAQALPPGSGSTSSSSDLTLGVVAPVQGVLTTLNIKYTGSASNVGGQTVTATLLKNGVAVTGASISSIATTSGTKTGSVSFTPVTYAAGDVITVTITPSSALTAALTDVMASAA